MPALPFLGPNDRAPVVAGVSVAFVVAKIIALHGQPLNRADVCEAIELAEVLIKEVERRHDEERV